ncbi:amino acid transporter [Ilyonectria destructans]|nr:amino acid transporter [Ilyonectria destructans]
MVGECIETKEHRTDLEKQKTAEGAAHFHRLGWKRLTIVLIVETIALGSLSLPAAFATTLGMVAGVILTVSIGLVAIYTSYVIGQVKLLLPEVSHYADVGRLMGARFGCPRFGYELMGTMFCLQLIFLTGSHCLTGTIVLLHITDDGAFSGNWSAWPKEGTGFSEAFIAITNIVFAYSFAICQFSFMDEIHMPTDYVVIYTFVGALVVDSDGGVIAKIAFGIALPVIYISGSINTTVAARYIHGSLFKDPLIRFINAPMGWLTWLGLVFSLILIAWIIAEAIPFFSDLLSISSSLFISAFSFYFPAMMWFTLVKQGAWYRRENILKSLLNMLILVIGMVILVGGTYTSIIDIIHQFEEGTVHGVFTCAPLG